MKLDIGARDELWEHTTRVLEQLCPCSVYIRHHVRTDLCSIECIYIYIDRIHMYIQDTVYELIYVVLNIHIYIYIYIYI